MGGEELKNWLGTGFWEEMCCYFSSPLMQDLNNAACKLGM